MAAAAITLQDLVTDAASAVEAVDRRRPQARSARGGRVYQPGIGPHTESSTIKLVAAEMASSNPGRYGHHAVGVAYLDDTRRKCDLCIGDGVTRWEWAFEAKLLRLLGDNGRPNDSMITHIVSPYDQHRSALTDSVKLTENAPAARGAVLILGYDYDGLPMDPAIEAFETLARSRVELGRRFDAGFSGLCHPVHQRGRVLAWEVIAKR